MIPKVQSIPQRNDFSSTDRSSFDSGTPFAAEGKELLGLLRQKAPDDEVETVLNKIQEQARNAGLQDPAKYPRDAYVTCICHIGAKSLSHVLSCIERCKEKLAAIGAETPTAQ